MAAPDQMQMGDGVMVYQKTSQCCRTCCCQPNIDWTIHDYKDNWGHEDNLPVKMTIKEDAPYIGRCMSNCWPAWRKTKYTVRAGEEGETLFTHEKAYTCSNCPVVMYGDGGPVRIPCCCCLPYLETKGPDGELLGKSKYVCDSCLFVPKFDLEDAQGTRLYRVRPETCCMGICVRCRCCDGQGKGKCFRIPFQIRQPQEPFEQVGKAEITDLWAGMKHECCTNREMYAVKFPQDNRNAADAEKVKKTLIGMTLLIDLTLNEQDQ